MLPDGLGRCVGEAAVRLSSNGQTWHDKRLERLDDSSRGSKEKFAISLKEEQRPVRAIV
jgi:hypothetical protein